MRRRRTLQILLGAAAIAATGCDALPPQEATLSGDRVRTQLERTLGLRFHEAGRPRGANHLADLDVSYAAHTREEAIAVLVFERAAAVRQATGSARRAGSVRTIRRRNVLVVYDLAPGAPDRTARIRSALAQLDDASG